jgi:hypothetical protein
MEEDVKTNVEQNVNDDVTSASNKGDNTPDSVPYERFQEVVENKNNYKTQLNELNSKIKELEQKNTLSGNEKKELNDNKDIASKIEEILENREKRKIEKEKIEQRKFENDVEKELDVYPDVKKTEFLKFMENEADEYGIKDVSGGMKLFRKLNDLTEKTKDEAKKEILSKPYMPRSEGTGGQKADTSKEDKGKSLSQIAGDIIQSMKK